MTETAPSSSPSVPGRRRATAPPAPTRWTGWIWFAATMMVLMGSLHAIAGLLALLNDEYYEVGKGGLAVEASYTVWGWTHLVVGAVVVAAGWALVYGRMWGRVVGVAVAGVSVILNVAFMAAYPVYGAIVIAIDLLVIWAITVHGSEMTST
jgi:hypothetical protein